MKEVLKHKVLKEEVMLEVEVIYRWLKVLIMIIMIKYKY